MLWPIAEVGGERGLAVEIEGNVEIRVQVDGAIALGVMEAVELS